MLPSEIVLFVLRLCSAALLLATLGAVLWFLRRDYGSQATSAPARPARLGRLLVVESVEGDLRRTGAGFELRNVTRIGRAATNAVQIDDTFVSSDHAVLALRDGRWWLEDQGSKNGTLLNGLPISQPTIVMDGDIIEIGSRAFQLELSR